MSLDKILTRSELFSDALFEKMKQINPGVADLELYEFRYALANMQPEQANWSEVHLDECTSIEQRVNDINFYQKIRIKFKVGNRITLDPAIVSLTNMLFVGLVSGKYPVGWVRQHFYFDIRGFYFLHRPQYFTRNVIDHLAGQPYLQFEQKQAGFDRKQDIGYKEFSEANADVDQAFIQCVHKLIAYKGTPIMLAIAGATAAGKTEIVERLRKSFEESGQKTTSIEMDNFLTDRDYRRGERHPHPG